MNILYKNANHERSTHFQYKKDYCNKDDLFWKRYFALVKNLDEESAETVNNILNRLQKIFSDDKEELDIFDINEKKQLGFLKEAFYNKIFQISSDVFAYKNYWLPENYFDINVFYYKYGCELFYNLKKIKKGNIIDAGAYIGDSSIFFSRMIDKTVFAFEALKENCEKIKKTIELNRVSNIRIINAAVGKESGLADIDENDTPNWSTMKPYDSRYYKNKKTVLVRSIDDFVNENKISVSLIKLHVEGMEFEAIQGAEKTLRKQKPSLLIHIHHTPNDFWSIKPYIENLGLEYKFKIYKPINGNIFTGTMLLAEVI